MAEPRQLAVVRSYDELIAALSARAIELQITRKQLAEVAGIADGSATSMLAPGGVKSFGRVTLGPVLGALGLQLVVQEDEDALKRIKNRAGSAKTSYMLNGVKNASVILKFSRRHMFELGKKSGEMRRKSIPKRTRSRIARQAAKARWRKPNISELPPEEAARVLEIEANKYRRFRAKQRMGKLKKHGALPEV